MEHLPRQPAVAGPPFWKSSSVLDKTLGLFLVMLSCVCLVCYPWEFLGRPKERARWYSLPKPSQQNLKLSLWLPHAAWLICGILGIIQLFLESSSLESCGELEQPNPDIAGMGVRVGLMSIMGLTILSLIAGAFGYRGDTGAKELGAISLAGMYESHATHRGVCSLTKSQDWQL
jgi:hypothetical protein